MKKILLLITGILLGVVSVVCGQDQAISGQVTDTQTGEALPGVNIVVQGTSETGESTIGTQTDINGTYSLHVPENLNTLVFSYIGYQTEEIEINGRTEINVSLNSVAISGEELIVVGYGTQRRDDITGSVTQIQGNELANQPSVQTSSALMGKVPGVTVTQNSGQPGSNDGTIRIRGIGTLGNSDPLVLIDGVEGDMNDISSSDIENISILKDAAAAAVYGSRAANGVILITTRRGLGDGIQVNYRGFGGWRQPANQPEFTDAGTFMRLENIAATNLGSSPIWSDSFIQEWEANHQTDPDNYPNTDWVGSLFSEPGFQQMHHLNISGGTERLRYMGSLAYDEENGNVPNFGFQRYSVRLNTDVMASENLSFDFDLNVQRMDHKEPPSSLTVLTGLAYRVPAIYADKYTHGGWGPGWSGSNPVARANDGGLREGQTHKIRGRFRMNFQPTDALDINVMYSPDYETSFSRRMVKQYAVTSPESADEILQLVSSQNSLSQGTDNRFSNNLNLTAAYRLSTTEHSVRVLGGYEYIDFRRDVFDAFRDDFTLQEFSQLNAGSSANMQNSGSASEWALQSIFGRINYHYKSRYLFEANVRYDGSSRFAEENRWGIFPSFSAGWIISEESFFEPLDLITNLKVRGSWGQLGNQEIGTYPFSSVVSLGENYLFGGSTVSGAAQLDLANPYITWETTTSSNVGVDVALLDDRLFFTFDYFNRETRDILLRLPIPVIIGLTAPYQNAGIVKNTGWEFELGYASFIGNDFSYNVSFNISDIQNEVIDLKGAGPFISGNSIIAEGYPINAIYGYESDGLFSSQAEVDNHASQSGQIAPGDIRYVDQNGDGVIDASDRTIIGDPIPSFNYGIDISMNYKNFDFSAFIQGVGSRDVLLREHAVWPFYNAGKIRQWQAEDYWTPENLNAKTPRLTHATTHSNFTSSDYWVYDASYLRLRNLQIGYTLPERVTDSMRMREIRVFFLGQNLLTLFNNMPPGIDPNVPNGTTGAYYPVTRLISAGINLNF